MMGGPGPAGGARAMMRLEEDAAVDPHARAVINEDMPTPLEWIRAQLMEHNPAWDINIQTGRDFVSAEIQAGRLKISSSCTNDQGGLALVVHDRFENQRGKEFYGLEVKWKIEIPAQGAQPALTLGEETLLVPTDIEFKGDLAQIEADGARAAMMCRAFADLSLAFVDPTHTQHADAVQMQTGLIAAKEFSFSPLPGVAGGNAGFDVYITKDLLASLTSNTNNTRKYTVDLSAVGSAGEGHVMTSSRGTLTDPDKLWAKNVRFETQKAVREAVANPTSPLGVRISPAIRQMAVVVAADPANVDLANVDVNSYGTYLNSKIDTKKQEFIDLTEKLLSIDGTLDQAAKMKALRSKVLTLSNMLPNFVKKKGLTDEFWEFIQKTRAANHEIKELAEKKAQEQINVDQLNEELAPLNERLVPLNEALAARRAELAALPPAADPAAPPDPAHQNLQQQITTLEGQITPIQEQVDALAARRVESETAIRGFENRESALRKGLTPKTSMGAGEPIMDYKTIINRMQELTQELDHLQQHVDHLLLGNANLREDVRGSLSERQETLADENAFNLNLHRQVVDFYLDAIGLPSIQPSHAVTRFVMESRPVVAIKDFFQKPLVKKVVDVAGKAIKGTGRVVSTGVGLGVRGLGGLSALVLLQPPEAGVRIAEQVIKKANEIIMPVLSSDYMTGDAKAYIESIEKDIKEIRALHGMPSAPLDRCLFVLGRWRRPTDPGGLREELLRARIDAKFGELEVIAGRLQTKHDELEQQYPQLASVPQAHAKAKVDQLQKSLTELEVKLESLRNSIPQQPQPQPQPQPAPAAGGGNIELDMIDPDDVLGN